MQTEQQDTIYALAFRGDLGFAACASGLMRRDGAQWRPAYDALNLNRPLPTTALAIAPAENRVIFAGVEGGILRSDDAGNTWHVNRLPDPPSVVTAFAIPPDFAQGGSIIAATMEDGIFRSEDGGNDWQPWNFGLLDRRVLCLAPSDAALFAGTESGIYRSDNRGRSWQVTATRQPVIALATAAGRIYAGTEDGLLVSTDHGAGWVALLAEDEAVNALIADNQHVLVLTGDRLRVSRDAGVSWQDIAGTDSITAVAAPNGLEPGAAIWTGQADGSITRLILTA